MTRFKELKRIQAAIQHRAESELRWADEYCRMRVKSAVLNEHKSYWKGIQRNVDTALREACLTEDHITAHKWSSYHRSTLMKSDVCGCFYFWKFFRRPRLKIGPTMTTQPFALSAALIL
jgi:hypothetical protein